VKVEENKETPDLPSLSLSLSLSLSRSDLFMEYLNKYHKSLPKFGIRASTIRSSQQAIRSKVIIFL
jgi:hypothetical protein